MILQNRLENKIIKILLISVFGIVLSQQVNPAKAASNEAAGQAEGGQSAEELAKKLSNPIASLISVPLQLNYDENIGPGDAGTKVTLNIQPVIPVSINENWNMISRTILPVVNQNDIFPGAGRQQGVGDIVQSLFFSPKALTKSGWTWGIGPVFLLPTGSKDELTADAWGLGPTIVALKQQGAWTVGGLANHIWSVDVDNGRPDINATFLQPFVSYTTPKAVSITLNSESTYNWESEQWSVPINFTATKVSRIGKQMISWGGGVRYYADSTDGGPEGWGARLILTFLYPK